MRKISIVIVLLVIALLLAGCGKSNQTSTNNSTSDAPIVIGTGDTSDADGSETGGTEQIALPAFEIDLPEEQVSDFYIETEVENGFIYDGATNTYKILLAGEYNCYGALYEGQLAVCAPETAKVVINLNGCILTNSQNAPIYIFTADKTEISAKKDTESKVYDLRTLEEMEEETTAGSAAIYAACDLTLKGKGALEVISDYYNGVHTKDDLEIQNLSLSVKAVNNAIKGNDSVTIESGTVVAVSAGGDAVKTTSTDTNKNGEQRGVVEIAGGRIALYAACDGIDSASDVRISGEAAVNIYTDIYSPFSGDVMISSSTTLYLRMTSGIYNKGYHYSAYFYNTDGGFQWASASYFGKATATTQAMPPRGPGGGTTYYYYAVQKPAGFDNVIFYAYSGTQAENQSDSYTAVSNGDATISAAWDTYAISSVSVGILYSSGWTNYQSSSGNTGLAYSCKGIKADNEVEISGGTVVIQAKDDAIHANFDTVLESTGKVGTGNIVISGGKLTISSDDDGIHADQDLTISGGNLNVLTSYEGLEANRIYVSGGSVTVYAKDDGINANTKGSYGALIAVSGGVLDVAVPSGDTDTMDSNGKITITGGVIFLKNGTMNGKSMAGGTIDADGTVSVTGGTVIVIGCIGETIGGANYSTSQSFAAGDYVIRDEEGNEVVVFTLTSSYKAYIFYSDRFVSGQTYTVYRDSAELFGFKK